MALSKLAKRYEKTMKAERTFPRWVRKYLLNEFSSNPSMKALESAYQEIHAERLAALEATASEESVPAPPKKRAPAKKAVKKRVTRKK